MASPIREVTPDPNDDIYITSPTTSSRIPQSFANSSPQNQHHSGQAALHPAPLVLDEGATTSRNLDSALAHAHNGANNNNTNNLRNNNNNQPSRLAQRAQALAGVQFLHDTSQLNSSLNRLPLSPSHQNLRSPGGNADVLNGNRSPGMHRPTSVPTHLSGGLDFNFSSAQNQQSALLPPAMKVRTAGGNNAQGADSVSSGSTGESQNYINNNNKEGESGSMTPPRIQNTNTSFGSQGSVGGGGGAPGSLLTVFTGHETNNNNNNVNTPQRYTPRNEDIVIAGGDPGFSNFDKRSDLDSQKQGNAGRVLSDEGDKNDTKNNANFGGKQDQEKNSRGFRPSLRVVIAFACGLVILIVAVVTLAVTDTISTQTVRSLGLRLSTSYVTSATNKAEDYFNRPYNDLRSFTYLFKKPNVTELRDTPDMSVYQFCDGSRMLLESSNYTYPTVGLLGDSGSVFGVLPYFDIGMVGCGLRNNWNATLAGKSINDVAFFYMSNKTQVPAFAIPPNSFDATPVDSRGASYSAMKSVAEKTPGVIYALSPASYLDGSNITSLNMPFFASVYNASMIYIGIAALSISSDKLNVFFLATDRTPNGHIVAIDRTFEIIASTVPNVATALTYRQAESLPVPNGCSSSAAILTNPFPGIVCPYTLTTYKYRPCNVLAAQNDLKFLAPRRGQVMYQETDVDGEAYFMVSSSVPNPASLFALFIIFFMPTSDILSSIVSGRNLTIGITAAIFFVAIIAAVLLVFRLLKPLNQILYLMDLATKLELDTSLTDVQSNATSSSSTDSRKANFSSIAEIYELQMAYKKMASAIDAFTKFFPREIIRDIAESGTLCKLGMRPGYASTSFLDIAGFTSISERVPNTDLAIALTIFYEQLSWCLQKTTGQLVAILGDGAFCCWNVPSVCLKHEMKAALFALMMSRETAKEPLAGAFDDMGEKLFLRIGLSSGEVAHGNCGSSQRMSWSVYSNSVNFSARLESINKQFGTRVMISDSIAMKVQNLILLRFIMPVQVVGKEEVTTIYEPVGLLPDIVLDAVAPKHEELHSLQSMSRMENSLSYSLANPSKYAASLSGHDSSMPHVSRRKNANVTAREVLTEMLSWEDASLKVSQLELDFVHAYNQCSQSFAEGNPSLCLQQLAEVRRSFPMFFYDDFGAALKRAIQEQKEIAERTHTVSSGSSMGSNNNNNNSTVKFYHPADRCESCLIQAEMSAQKLETLCVSIQARMLKQQQMNTASGSTGIQEYQEPVGLHDFVFRADHK